MGWGFARTPPGECATNRAVFTPELIRVYIFILAFKATNVIMSVYGSRCVPPVTPNGHRKRATLSTRIHGLCGPNLDRGGTPSRVNLPGVGHQRQAYSTLQRRAVRAAQSGCRQGLTNGARGEVRAVLFNLASTREPYSNGST